MVNNCIAQILTLTCIVCVFVGAQVLNSHFQAKHSSKHNQHSNRNIKTHKTQYSVDLKPSSVNATRHFLIA